MAVLKDKVRKNGVDGWTQHGIATFLGTAATFELPVKFGAIKSFSLTPIGAYGANDRLSINAAATGGVIRRPAGGTVTVTRNTGGTADLPFSYILNCE